MNDLLEKIINLYIGNSSDNQLLGFSGIPLNRDEGILNLAAELKLSVREIKERRKKLAKQTKELMRKRKAKGQCVRCGYKKCRCCDYEE